jgi:hypothetical protein
MGGSASNGARPPSLQEGEIKELKEMICGFEERFKAEVSSIHQ